MQSTDKTIRNINGLGVGVVDRVKEAERNNIGTAEILLSKEFYQETLPMILSEAKELFDAYIEADSTPEEVDMFLYGVGENVATGVFNYLKTGADLVSRFGRLSDEEARELGKLSFDVTAMLASVGIGLTSFRAEFARDSATKSLTESAGNTLNKLPKTAAESVRIKLDTYLLEPTHSVGGSKAKWFKEALGFSKDNSTDLAKQIVFDPKRAVQTATNAHGTKFSQIISVQGANGKVIDVEFIFIKNNDGVIRFITSIPTKR